MVNLDSSTDQCPKVQLGSAIIVSKSDGHARLVVTDGCGSVIGAVRWLMDHWVIDRKNQWAVEQLRPAIFDEACTEADRQFPHAAGPRVVWNHIKEIFEECPERRYSTNL
ncbi:hypothetical protein EXS70_03925 [Candidatus Peribacteria bacterium]|nr:hypothetical protein [Candidatus Peribacteria bacterium]